VRFRDGSDKGTESVLQLLCKSREKYDGALAILRQVLEEESMSTTRIFEWQAPLGAKSKQSQEHAHHFFDIKRIAHKEFILASKNSPSHIKM
jgi:hypothetical protein